MSEETTVGAATDATAPESALAKTVELSEPAAAKPITSVHITTFKIGLQGHMLAVHESIASLPADDVASILWNNASRVDIDGYLVKYILKHHPEITLDLMQEAFDQGMSRFNDLHKAFA